MGSSKGDSGMSETFEKAAQNYKLKSKT